LQPVQFSLQEANERLHLLMQRFDENERYLSQLTQNRRVTRRPSARDASMKFRLSLATTMLGLWPNIARLSRFSVPLRLKPQNQGGGTYWDLEQRWASQLKSGVGVDVTVREMSRKGEDRPYHRHVSWLETHKDFLILDELDFVNTMSPKGRMADGVPKVDYDSPAKVVDLPKMQRNGAGGQNDNTPSLQMPFWTATNDYAAKLGATVVQRDMASVRAGLLYGLERSEIQAFLTGRHGQGDNARFYAHGLVDSVRGQIKGELAARRATGRSR
jgi:hypothetical protein